MIAIPLATYRADPKGAADLAERDPDGRVVVTNDDGSTYLTIAIPKGVAAEEHGKSMTFDSLIDWAASWVPDEPKGQRDRFSKALRDEVGKHDARLRAKPGGRLVEAARELVLQIRGALTVEDPDEGWDEVRSAHAALESALAALPEAGAASPTPKRQPRTLEDVPDDANEAVRRLGIDVPAWAERIRNRIADHDIRALLAEAQAALEAMGCCPEVHACDTCLPRTRAAAEAIGEVLTSRPPVIGVDTCRRCGKAERPSYEHDRSLVCAGCHVELKLTDVNEQLAREREAVDGLVQVIDDLEIVDHLDDQTAMRDAIEAVRKSREGAPSVGPRLAPKPDAKGRWIGRAYGEHPHRALVLARAYHAGDAARSLVLVDDMGERFADDSPIIVDGEWYGPIPLPDGWT